MRPMAIHRHSGLNGILDEAQHSFDGITQRGDAEQVAATTRSVLAQGAWNSLWRLGVKWSRHFAVTSWLMTIALWALILLPALGDDPVEGSPWIYCQFDIEQFALLTDEDDPWTLFFDNDAEVLVLVGINHLKWTFSSTHQNDDMDCDGDPPYVWWVNQLIGQHYECEPPESAFVRIHAIEIDYDGFESVIDDLLKALTGKLGHPIEDVLKRLNGHDDLGGNGALLNRPPIPGSSSTRVHSGKWWADIKWSIQRTEQACRRISHDDWRRFLEWLFELLRRLLRRFPLIVTPEPGTGLSHGEAVEIGQFYEQLVIRTGALSAALQIEEAASYQGVEAAFPLYLAGRQAEVAGDWNTAMEMYFQAALIAASAIDNGIRQDPPVHLPFEVRALYGMLPIQAGAEELPILVLTTEVDAPTIAVEGLPLGSSYRVEPLRPHLHLVYLQLPPDARGGYPLTIRATNGQQEVATPLELKIYPPSRVEGDVNGDRCVDDADLLAVLFAFGQAGEDMPEDVNRDDIVDDADLLIVLFNFGSGC
jgi:hypothetical protein